MPRDENLEEPVDLVDFYSRWSDFRHRAVAVVDLLDQQERDAEIVKWLVALADRIGPMDIERDSEATGNPDQVLAPKN